MALFNQFPWSNFHEINLDWLIKTVKEIKKDYDEYDKKFGDLKNDVDNTLDKINDKTTNMQEYVDNYLDELINEGHGEELFRQANMNFKYNFKRVLRTLHKTNYSLNNFDDTTPIYLQGACLGENGTYYYALINKDATKAKIYQVSQTGAIINESELLEGLGKANDMTLYNNKLFIATQTNDIVIVNATTLEKITTRTQNFNVWNIAYDKNGTSIYRLVTVSNGKAYYLDPNNYIPMTSRTLDIETENTAQGIGVNNGLIYFTTSNANTIKVYDPIGNKLLFTQNLGEELDGFTVGEVETCDFDADGNMVVFSANYLYNYTIMELFKTDIYKNISVSKPLSLTSTAHINNTKHSGTPDGTATKPFECYADFKLAKGFNCVSFDTVMPENEDIYLSVYYADVVEIFANKNVFGGFYFYGCGNVIINNMLFKENANIKYLRDSSIAYAAFCGNLSLIDTSSVVLTSKPYFIEMSQCNTVDLFGTFATNVQGFQKYVGRSYYCGNISASTLFLRYMRELNDGENLAPCRVGVNWTGSGSISIENEFTCLANMSYFMVALETQDNEIIIMPHNNGYAYNGAYMINIPSSREVLYYTIPTGKTVKAVYLW